MRSICIVIVILGIILTGQATGKIYRYVDDNGHTNFTNDLSTVPPNKRSKTSEYKEAPATYTPRTAKEPAESISRPPYQHPQPQRQKQRQQKRQMEAEYQGLLKEKEGLDNNKSFQKRRGKKKYQHRPHIKELLKKEEKIIQRLAEIDAYLKTFE